MAASFTDSLSKPFSIELRIGSKALRCSAVILVLAALGVAGFRCTVTFALDATALVAAGQLP